MNSMAPIQLSEGLTVCFEEDVFIHNGKKYVFLGKRLTLASIIEKKGDYFMCKIIKSAGANPDPVGAIIAKNCVLIFSSGRVVSEKQGQLGVDFLPKLKSGGHLEGYKDGQKVKMSDASSGGMSVGSKHSDGGIKGSVGTEARPIEFEGEEIILTAPVSNNPEKYEFEGEMLTGREIASKINQDNGGVAFADGGEVSHKCRCSGKQYKFGGSVFNDFDILRYIDFLNKSISERMTTILKK